MSGEKEIYVEYRFDSGLVLSGFVPRDEATSMFRDNADITSEPDQSAPLFQERLAVLLKDQQVVAFDQKLPAAMSAEARAFHPRNPR